MVGLYQIPHFQLVAASMLLGIIWGILFDVFRLRKILFPLGGEVRAYPKSIGSGYIIRLLKKLTKLGKPFQFAEDVLFCLFSAFALLLTCFKVCRGVIRGYALIIAFLFFLLYCYSFGRISKKIFGIISGIIIGFFGLITTLLIKIIFRPLKKLLLHLKKAISTVCGRLISEKLKRKLLFEADRELIIIGKGILK